VFEKTVEEGIIIFNGELFFDGELLPLQVVTSSSSYSPSSSS